MTSPAKRRKDRTARKRRKLQTEYRRSNAEQQALDKAARDILPTHWRTPDDLRDITPSRLITAA